ncbi:MAG: LysR family transcriptional regulator [Candidatus Thiodiazotropha sp. (ex Myrtea spinifera)]|nr:LysR family transcriptional regulator [Candidatus Thiodiazotropha sp. (ex Myrtea spinifera)]MCU7828296.1 LysR family transcriptional regulator [Candidatus Thiodiazotropha sp. (ex Myrtea sp. 'scaly one' KF741663)]
MIELSHLKIVASLERHGTLTAASNALCLSQSALSHQIRYLEKKLGITIWEKEGRRLRLTRAGRCLLDASTHILPLFEKTELTLKALAEGRQGQLRIGVECYPCYEWLTGVIATYLKEAPDVDVDIVHQFQFAGLEGLLNRHVDLLVTPDSVDQPGLTFEVLFDYELVLLVAESHHLAGLSRVVPEQLREETLITFPVAPERLDVLTRFLWPGGVRSVSQKQIESIEIMLQLVAFERGVCALPLWLAERVSQNLPLKLLHLGEAGVQRSLYAAFRTEDAELAYLLKFLELGRNFNDA